MNDTKFSKPSVKTAFVASILISCFAVTINILSIISLSKCITIDKRIRLMVRNVALADGFLGCSPALSLISDYFGFSNTVIGCTVHLVFARTMTLTKLFSVSILAVERFVCLYLANWYLKYVSKQLIFIVILVTWVTSLVITLGTYADKISFIADCLNENQAHGFIVILILSVVCGLVIIGAYIGVYLNVTKHARNIKALNISNTSKTSLYRSTIILFLLVLVFILCYMPTGIYRTVIYLHPEWLFETGGVRNITNIIFLSSTFINPLLYVLRFKECQLHMSKMFCWCKKQYMTQLDRRHKRMYASYLPTSSLSR